MHKRTLILTCAALAASSLFLQSAAKTPFDGRWDLTIQTPQETYPSWLEVTSNNGAPSVRLVGRVASVHPAKNVKLEGSKLTFSTQEYFGKQIPVEWEFEAASGKLTGTQHRGQVNAKITGDPAPALARKAPAAWGSAEPIFNGKDLSGWVPDDPAHNHYKAVDGTLYNEAPGANIHTTRKFQDFRLHFEANCPDKGNSGVYLRGRYEVQIEYEGTNDPAHSIGSIYGFLTPKPMPNRPGQWETFDVELVGRTVTIKRNGVVTIDHQQIPGITGGALDSHEAEPGPINIQGDHTGGMKYRNLTVQLPK